MIKLTATALVHAVTPVTEIQSKNGGQPFQKRELILDDSWEKDGNRYPNFCSIEFSGDAMSQLNGIYPGQKVTVEAYVNGREWNGRILNSIRGRSVTPAQTPAYQQPTPAYPQQPVYPQQGYCQAPYPQSTPAQAAAYPQQQAFGQTPSNAYQPNGYASAAPAPSAPQGGPQTAPTQNYQPQGYQQPQSPGVADLPWTPT